MFYSFDVIFVEKKENKTQINALLSNLTTTQSKKYTSTATITTSRERKVFPRYFF